MRIAIIAVSKDGIGKTTVGTVRCRRVILTDHQPETNIAAYTQAQAERYGLTLLNTKLRRRVAFKEMTFTGKVSTGGTTGAQVSFLIDELSALGALPFLEHAKASA